MQTVYLRNTSDNGELHGSNMTQKTAREPAFPLSLPTYFPTRKRAYLHSVLLLRQMRVARSLVLEGFAHRVDARYSPPLDDGIQPYDYFTSDIRVLRLFSGS